MISAVVLAAGLASRMGRPKQLLRIGGETLVRRAARTALAAGVDETIVVIGAAADEVGAELADLQVRAVVNPRYAEGQSTSLRAGIQALSPWSEAVVVLLVDQPLLRSEVVAGLISTFRHTGAPLVRPLYAGRRGNPVLFAAALYPELASVQGDAGARDVVRRHEAQAALVPFEDAHAQLDVDTWQEYEAVRALAEGGGG
jgi:molybdenum cofactor cytidylyltransferase